MKRSKPMRRGEPMKRTGFKRRREALRCCGKKTYPDQAAALTALAHAQTVYATAKVVKRAYECSNGWWHLTSKPGSGPKNTVREAVLKRDQYCCGRCGDAIYGKPWSIQHRRTKGSGGTSDPRRNLPSNLILLCGSATSPGGCHLFCEQRNSGAEADGFVVSLNSRVDPATIPVRHALYGLVYLDDEGGWLPAGESGTDRLLADLKDGA